MLDLWQRADFLPSGPDGLSVDQAVELLGSASSAVGLVAEVEDQIVGMALGLATPVVGWIFRLVMSPGIDEAKLADDLLEELEARLAEVGTRKLVSVVEESGEVRRALERRGFEPAGGLFMEREALATVPVHSSLLKLGGRMVSPGLWDQLRGLEHAKEIIDRRVILPLAEPELAARHAISPPRAIVLFGPPGTGKTTFAKGIASRLTWPFVEVQPRELAGGGSNGAARQLAEMFDRLLELGAAVVFVDEVEDLASTRRDERRVSPDITNEFLRQIPRLRDASQHLLVCATNWVGRLDPAFLRPGRFDYVLPVGPPDVDARGAIWDRYTNEITDEPIEIERLVEASGMFTPADIEFAARKAAQRAFEREHFEGVRRRAITEDFLGAIQDTRQTLTAEMLDSFDSDTEQFARY